MRDYQQKRDRERLATLEGFVSSMAAVQNLEGWQGDFFRRARELATRA